MGKTKRFVIDEEQLQSLMEISAKTAVEAYREEHERVQKERTKRIENNAKKLIMNYRRIKSMVDNAVYDEDTSCDLSLKDILELMSGWSRHKDLEVPSIKEKTVRTKLVMEHVDTMLEVYHRQCIVASDPEELRRWNVINGLYIADEPKTVQEIADEECITVSTVYRDCDKAYKKLAVLFFGIDGMKF